MCPHFKDILLRPSQNHECISHVTFHSSHVQVPRLCRCKIWRHTQALCIKHTYKNSSTSSQRQIKKHAIPHAIALKTTCQHQTVSSMCTPRSHHFTAWISNSQPTLDNTSASELPSLRTCEILKSCKFFNFFTNDVNNFINSPTLRDTFYNGISDNFRVSF